MREEEIDWLVFHLLDRNGVASTIRELAVSAGLTEEQVSASADRLSRAMLAEVRGDSIRALSVQEMLLASQCRFDDSTPFFIENGVVRVKRK